MAKVEIDLHESSLDNSADSEFIGMVDDNAFETVEYKNPTVTQAFLDTSMHDGNVAYRVVMDEDDMNQTNSHAHIMQNGEFFVIGNSQVYAHAPAKRPRKEPVEKVKRDDKRRATHNEVERRRRDKINNWITKLAALIPDTGLPESVSKGGILAKACDYITELTEKHKRYDLLEQRNDQLVEEVLKLNEQLAAMRKENSALHERLYPGRLKAEKP